MRFETPDHNLPTNLFGEFWGALMAVFVNFFEADKSGRFEGDKKHLPVETPPVALGRSGHLVLGRHLVSLPEAVIAGRDSE